jgi:hypothetical protein
MRGRPAFRRPARGACLAFLWPLITSTPCSRPVPGSQIITG